jgi:hypothetical protein
MFNNIVRLEYSVVLPKFIVQALLGSWYPFKRKLIAYIFRNESLVTVFTSAIPVTVFWKSWIQSTLSNLIILSSAQLTSSIEIPNQNFAISFHRVFNYTFLTARPIWFNPSDKIRRIRPASWSSGQSVWLLIMRSRVRFSVLPWGVFLKGEDSHGDYGLGSLI